LQSLLDERQQEFVDVIYSEVFDNAADLMVDPFGNYLCQKLMEKCNDQQVCAFKIFALRLLAGVFVFFVFLGAGWSILTQNPKKETELAAINPTLPHSPHFEKPILQTVRAGNEELMVCVCVCFQQIVEFIAQVSDSLVSISLNIHGTRAVQKLIDCVDRPHQIQVRHSCFIIF
jgi:hypothetical protein